MGFHDPFEYLKKKLWSKEGPRVKLPIWFLTTKSQELPRFICVQVACCISLKRFWWRLQLCLRFHFNYKFAQEVMGLQNHVNLNLKNIRIPNLGISGQNDIWVLASWPSKKNIIRGKVVASPKFAPWWILWVRVYPWLVRAPKVLQLCTNQLIVWFVQVHMNNWPTCHSS
jgi:hypothetical protein